MCRSVCSATERVEGAADGVHELVPHGLVAGVPRELDQEHAGLHSDQLQVGVPILSVRRCELHGVGRDVTGLPGTHHRDPVLVGGKLNEFCLL